MISKRDRDTDELGGRGVRGAGPGRQAAEPTASEAGRDLQPATDAEHSGDEERALHRAGDGGAAPSLRYRPASSLAERTDTEATLERQKVILRTEIDQLREQHQTEQAQIRANVRNRQKTENALEEAKRSLNRVLAEQQEAQKVIDRAARIRHLDALKRGEVPSPWDDTHQNNGPEFG